MTETASPARYVLEAAVLAVAVTVLNLFFPSDPGFLRSSVNPYVLAALLISAYRGWAFGYICLVFSGGLSVALFGLLLGVAFPLTYQIPDPGDIWLAGRVPLLVAVVGVYAFGQISRTLRREQQTAREVAEQLREQASRRQQQVTALTAVNRELEWRVVRLDDSVTLLSDHLGTMGHQRVDVALGGILDSVLYFTRAARCSLWEYDRRGDQLVLRRAHGWDPEDEQDAALPVSGTLEGWVVRNCRPFDIRLLLVHDSLRGLDHDEAVYILPLVAGGRSWGVLRIEELPVEKFNPYTERLLQLIVRLAGASLGDSLQFGGQLDPGDVHEETGYPRFEQFQPVLNREIELRRDRADSLSVVLLEVTNFTALVERYGRGLAVHTLVGCIDACARISANTARAFHYRSESQVALIYPNLDFDGAAMFAVSVLEWASTQRWEGFSRELQPQILIGYSSLSANTADTESLLETAENLLQVQRAS